MFRYGVAVLLGASHDAERALRERLSARTENAYESAESEELVARIERTIVDLISTRHSLRVEWYILLTIYQLWLQ